MARSRPGKTLADYAAIAVSPVLIVLLVGSFAFLLQELAYSGQHAGRLRWILAWFVLAIVLVSRIGIEQGTGHASVYGILLAAATTLVIMVRFPEVALPALLLMAIVWWCAHKLTWDCTLIDDNQDASGEGLLHVAGLDETGSAGTTASETSEPAQSEQSRSETPEDKVPFWRQLLENRSERAGKPHAPGLWVVYFSLLALPVFGVGQLLLPSTDTGTRRFAFRLLWIYTAAGLGLLLTTSFLGLRRYLRQRRLAMPGSMAAAWLGMGAVLVAIILLACLLLPRPQADYSLTAMLEKVASDEQEASRTAVLREEPGKGKGRRAGEKNEEADKQNEQDGAQEGTQGEGDGGRKSRGEQSSESEGRGRGQSRESTQNAKQGEQRRRQQENQGSSDETRRSQEKAGQQEKQQQASGKAAGDKPRQADRADEGQAQHGPQPQSWQMPELGSGLARLLQWLVYATLALLGIWFLVRNWSAIVAALRQILNALWSLFGGGAADTANPETSEATSAVPPRPFADFENPFVTGAADRMRPEHLVVYTFDALQAWASEQNCPREPEQTPLEFARRLGERFPFLAREAGQAARLYAGVAYADRPPSPDNAAALETLWRKMARSGETEPLSVPT